ncbi:hypothetical protein [Thioalkalivibrio sp.]|uniref:hypothetical protein n=1 Tax=Thioalkalivibrio sp. TaxID=2093813 RepID=UPI0025FB1B81|nr:hypothetical protein [Thioalkalivibrio sp.]
MSFTQDLDRAIGRETHFDPTLGRIDGLPWLRTNRFLAGFDYVQLDDAERQAWSGLGFALARDAYLLEFDRLSAQSRDALRARHGFETLGNRFDDCFAALPAPPTLGREAYAVPDGYRMSQRLLGLYPVTSLVARPFIAGYRRNMTDLYESGASATFAREARYRGQVGGARQHDAEIRVDALGVPRLSPEQWRALFLRHQPELVSEIASAADRIGSPFFDSDGRIGIDTERPTVWIYATFTRIDGRTLPQLNYAFWFPARPAESPLDIYAGELAGLLWRVTLDEAQRPVLYDSIHRCGCYHKLFLPKGTTIDVSRISGEKPLFFRLDETVDTRRGLRLRLAAGNHYIIDVDAPETGTGAIPYTLRPYAQQLALPTPDGAARSLYGADGIIRQSRRAERFLFWPLGIPSAGAMRQSGTHATAFIGRRHFDAPDLLDDLGITIPRQTGVGPTQPTDLQELESIFGANLSP